MDKKSIHAALDELSNIYPGMTRDIALAEFDIKEVGSTLHLSPKRPEKGFVHACWCIDEKRWYHNGYPLRHWEP